MFIQSNEGLENKLTRAPLLGLAKSMCELSVYRTPKFDNDTNKCLFSGIISLLYLFAGKVLFER